MAKAVHNEDAVDFNILVWKVEISVDKHAKCFSYFKFGRWLLDWKSPPRI